MKDLTDAATSAATAARRRAAMARGVGVMTDPFRGTCRKRHRHRTSRATA